MKVEIKSNKPNTILVDGIEYKLDREKTKKIDGVEHSEKLVFKKIDKEKYEEDFKLVRDTLAKKTTSKELINEILKPLDWSILRRLAKRIRKKKPIKKQEGCLGFKIGDAYIQLVD